MLTYAFSFSSRQPWSAYAVHLTTLSPPALLGDLLLVWLCHRATGSWGESLHDSSMTALYFWIFTSKWIKLLGHYLRYPVDVLLLPVSVLFGYFHGAIKMYAVMTLNVVCLNFPRFLFFCLFPCYPYYFFQFLFFQFRFFRILLSVGRMYIQAQPLLFPYFPFAYDKTASQRFDHCLLLCAVYLLPPYASLAFGIRSCLIRLPFPYICIESES